MSSDSKAGFTVKDRRNFTDSGEKREDDGAGKAGGGADGDRAGPGAAAAELDGGGDQTGGLPVVDFHTFVLSLGSSALLHLGELEHPDSGAPQPDLGLAKHTIDIISMLQEKTKGNLTPPEEKLIESLLYDLRLRYVEKTQG